MKRKLLRIILLTSLMIGSGVLIGISARSGVWSVVSATMMQTQVTTTESDEDAQMEARRDSLVNKAGEGYKDIIFMKTEGEDYAVIYPKVYQNYLDNLEALEACEPHSENWIKCRNTLVDLDYELEAGAYFYSGQNNPEEMAKFVQAYIDLQMIDAMKDVKFRRDEKAYASMAYIAASSAYNNKEFNRAIRYFKLYFSAGGTDKRHDVFLFMGYACLNSEDYDLAISTMREGLKQYPNDFKMMELALEACQKGNHGELLQEFLTPALALNPTDTRLLDLQGKIYEDANDYKQALNIYTQLDELTPNMLSINKHIAFDYYNIAVSHFNEANRVQDEKAQRKNRRMSKDYFFSAVNKLEEVLASDPMDVRTLKCLGMTYLCLEQRDKFDEINRQLKALGEDAVSGMVMPSLVSYDPKGSHFETSDGLITGSSVEAPLYSEYSKKFVTDSLLQFTTKGEYERTADYLARVNDDSFQREYTRLNQMAQETYLKTYGSRLRISEAKLLPYDANNETYGIETSNGLITVKVPNLNGEAQRFKANWEGMRLRNPKFFIYDNQVRVASVDVLSPDGRTYKFDNETSHTYRPDDAQIDVAAFIRKRELEAGKGSSVAKKVTTVTIESDVDENIPITNKEASKTFALIIANENYANTGNVESALHDGRKFAEYCNKTFGLPQQNVTLIENATLGQMIGAIDQLKRTIEAFNGEGDVILYYAGHGVPDEKTKEAYLLPTDCYPTSVATSFPLNRLYSELSGMSSRRTLVFMDACFSGINRDGRNLNPAARGVEIAAKPVEAKGNMYVFTAATSAETALPYREKNHGMFTYYLLKKLQETAGDVTLKDLSDYVITKVKQQSNLVNKKSQTPTLSVSGPIAKQLSTTKIVQ